jgi:hypothetical protein
MPQDKGVESISSNYPAVRVSKCAGHIKHPAFSWNLSHISRPARISFSGPHPGIINTEHIVAPLMGTYHQYPGNLNQIGGEPI